MIDFTWKSGVSDNWSTASDWTPVGGPPDASNDSVLINAEGSYIVSVGSPGDINITANQVTLDDAGATLDITQGATLALSGTSEMLAVTAGTLDVSGTLIDNGGVGVSLGQGTVNNFGLISSTGIGVKVNSSAGTLNNLGTLVSYGDAAVFAQISITFQNLGTISGAVNGLTLAGGSTVTNGARNDTKATITGANTGVFFGGIGTLTNFGTITGSAAVGLGQGTITNSGLISSTGIDIVVGSGGGAVINSGVITGTGTDGVFAASGSETINNSGTIATPNSHADGVQIDNGSITNGSTNDTTATISAGNTGAYSSGSGTVSNFGTVLGDCGVGINDGTVSNYGFVTGIGDGVVLGGSATLINRGLITNTGTTGEPSGGVYTQAGTVLIDNYGTILGEAFENTGIIIAHSLADINNYGSIYGLMVGINFSHAGSTLNNDGVITSGGFTGVFAQGSDTVNNLGTISAMTSTGIGEEVAAGSSVTNGDRSDTTASIIGGKVGLFSGGTITLANAGTITGAGAGLQVQGTISNSGLISSAGFGILLGGNGTTLINSGSVQGTGSDGVFSTNTETVSNTGTIIGGTIGLQLAAGSNVTNSGTIEGASGVFLAGASKFTDSGSLISTAGATGVAIGFGGGSQLVVDPGATFVGGIFGSGGVLELAAGNAAGSIGSISQAATLTVDQAANWSLQGTNTVSDVSDQGTLALGVNATLTVAGTLDQAGGVIALDAGAVLDIMAGVGSSAPMQFLGSAQVEVQHAAQFGIGVGTSTYVGPLIELFNAGDSVDLRDIVASGATMNYTASTGLLQITSGADKASLRFDTTSLGSGSFHLSSDNTGHLLVTHS